MVIERSSVITIAVLCAVIAVVSIGTYLVARSQTDDQVDTDTLSTIQGGEVLPYTDLNGVPFDLLKLKGKPIIINSWATWSPLSEGELRQLIEVKREFMDQIEVVAINRKEPPVRVKSYVEMLGNPSEIEFLLDPGDIFYPSVQGYAMPESIFYDRQGRLVEHVRGTMGSTELRTQIMELIHDDGRSE